MKPSNKQVRVCRAQKEFNEMIQKYEQKYIESLDYASREKYLKAKERRNQLAREVMSNFKNTDISSVVPEWMESHESTK